MCDKRLCSCRQKSAASNVDPEILRKLEEGYKLLKNSDSPSLLKKYLTRDVFDKLKKRKTSYGSTLLHVIQSGVENLDSGIGIYAPDPEAYTVFAELFDPIIEDYHGGFGPDDIHPLPDWGKPADMGNLDPSGNYVISTRVRTGRSLAGYPFNPSMSETHYYEIENKVTDAFGKLEDDLKGQYYPLVGMEKDVQKKLIDDHFLFKEGDRFLQSAEACKYWPTGRGIYLNQSKTFLVWCNEEDHLRIISMQEGGDLGEVYARLVRAVTALERNLKFSRNERIGYLNFCPTNLGSAVRASVHVKLPKLSANLGRFEEIAGMYNLQVRGTRGEHCEGEGGIYDVSNKRRMGLTEYEALVEMRNGVLEMIRLEKEA
ncbi:arginine kinase [Neodiprion pinetum]|uniref:arginine kinase n=1 Tax=Neodiprion pinetum TaxID=441929 RepID=UPI00076FD739|nr:arginine kinase-like [Neodiprion pinetum]